MKTIATILILIISLSSSPAQGTNNNQNDQNLDPSNEDTPSETSNSTDEEDLKRFWQIQFKEGHYMVALDRIANISKHEYLLDGNLIITEVTIDTTGNSLCRIYQITPAAERGQSNLVKRAAQRARDVTERVGELTGADFTEMVHKNFPTTTHAKTIEYRVQHKGTLNALYGSLVNAWTTGKGRRFTVGK
ncbi:MAG: hypothetical protein AAGC74_10125 [Verrucomicrobiota bacterium]